MGMFNREQREYLTKKCKGAGRGRNMKFTERQQTESMIVICRVMRFVAHFVTGVACQASMGPRDISPIVLIYKHLHH